MDQYLIMETCLESLPAVSIMTRIVAHSCRPLQSNPWLQRDVGIDTARLHAMAGTGFAGATELLEQLVTQTGIEFRRLKRVVEYAVHCRFSKGPLIMSRMLPCPRRFKRRVLRFWSMLRLCNVCKSLLLFLPLSKSLAALDGKRWKRS